MSGPAVRILFVENGIAYGGAVTCLRNLVRALDSDAYHPIIVTARADDPYPELGRHAQWVSIRDRWVDTGALRQALERASWARRMPAVAALCRQALARLDDIANLLPYVVKLCWTMLRVQPHIVHTNNEPLCNRAAVLAGKLLRLPVVSHVRGDPVGSFSMKLLFRLPDHVIAVSRWIGEEIRALGVPARRSSVIYDGINFAELQAAPDGAAFRHVHGIPRAAFAVGLPAVLMPWKGQELFLKAAIDLARECPDMWFIIVGATPKGSEGFERSLRDLVARSEIAARTVFTGHVADMPSAYAALDAVVSASTAPEPFGIAVVEAMALGRAVIAPAHGGALEIVEHERTGLLFTANDVSALRRAIRRIYDEPGLRRRLGTQAAARVIEQFSAARSAHQVQELYAALLK